MKFNNESLYKLFMWKHCIPEIKLLKTIGGNISFFQDPNAEELLSAEEEINQLIDDKSEGIHLSDELSYCNNEQEFNTKLALLMKNNSEAINAEEGSLQEGSVNNLLVRK